MAKDFPEGQFEEGQEMSFWEHLEELRKRIILAVVGIVIACIITGIFSDQIMQYILLFPAAHTSPPIKLINLKPYGFLAIYMQVILIAGVILSLPFSLFQFWKFIAPGLKSNERRWVRWITFYTSLCFLTGIAFAFFVALPSMLTFFAGFTPNTQVENQWSINEYLSTVVGAIVTGGIIFELPMVCFFLGKLGILSPTFMRRYRRHAIVVILIIAALVTPTPDPLTQLIFAFPLWFLYEISIFVVGMARRKRDAARAIA
jgi:sec-independent protein translocase protein TatC